jgi:hypothetical protein
MEQEQYNHDINLFNDPHIMSIKNSLPKDFVEDLRLKGESMYKDIDFENETINHVIKDNLFIIKEQLKSGLHPSLLEPIEKQILQEELGNEWYKKFGYDERDLNEIFTLQK